MSESSGRREDQQSYFCRFIPSAVARFHDLYGGLHHGIAWDWDRTRVRGSDDRE
jgi:hypothetical protein